MRVGKRAHRLVERMRTEGPRLRLWSSYDIYAADTLCNYFPDLFMVRRITFFERYLYCKDMEKLGEREIKMRSVPSGV